MRAVVQRVTSASVTIEGNETARIGRGLVALVGVAKQDTDRDAHWLAEKLVTLRVFEDAGGKMNLSLEDVARELLVVSNFTVCADAQKGRRPSFDESADFDTGLPLYQRLLSELGSLAVPLCSGEYGAEMMVQLVNDGPVTIIVESPQA